MPDLAPLQVQSQQAALTPEALDLLDVLRKQSSSTYHQLQERLAKAVQHITEVSTQINDRGSAERARYNKKRSRLIAKGQNEEDEEEKRENAEFQDKVVNVTKQLDQKIRRVIDNRVWLENVPDAVAHIVNEAGTTTNSRSTQATTQENEDMDIDDWQGPDSTQQTSQLNPSHAPTALLHAALSTNETRWKSRTLTERYSKDNDYVGWYRMVYDAQHPGETAPQMPHASLWFAEEEDRDATTIPRPSQRRSRSDARNPSTPPADDDEDVDSESDIEIAAERIRIKCPLTLLPYKDPLASTKCPHAFEKSAILDMLQHTSEFLPLTSEQVSELSQITRTQERSRREKQIQTRMVRCPECSVPLTKNDLRPDPVLLRKVNRILDKERRKEEAEREHGDSILDADEDEDDDHDDSLQGPSQRRKVVHLGSSPAQSFRRQSGRPVKSERHSMVPQTQPSDDDSV